MALALQRALSAAVSCLQAQRAVSHVTMISIVSKHMHERHGMMCPWVPREFNSVAAAAAAWLCRMHLRDSCRTLLQVLHSYIHDRSLPEQATFIWALGRSSAASNASCATCSTHPANWHPAMLCKQTTVASAQRAVARCTMGCIAGQSDLRMRRVQQERAHPDPNKETTCITFLVKPAQGSDAILGAEMC